MTPAALSTGSYSLPVNDVTRYFDNYYADTAGYDVTGTYEFSGGTETAPATMGALFQSSVSVSGKLDGKLNGGENTIGVWVNAAAEVTDTGSMTFTSSSGASSWAGVIAGGLTNRGTVTTTGGTGNASIALQVTNGLTNSGTLSVTGGGGSTEGTMSLGAYLQGTLANTGTVTAKGGDGISGVGLQAVGDITNSGAFTATGGGGKQAAGILHVSGSVANASGKTLTAKGGSGYLGAGWVEQASMTNSGTLDLTGDSGQFAYGLNLSGSDAELTNASGATVKAVAGMGSSANGLRADSGTTFINKGVFLPSSVDLSATPGAVILGDFTNEGVVRANYQASGDTNWGLATQGTVSNTGQFFLYSNGLSIAGGIFTNSGSFTVESDRAATGVTLSSGARFVNDRIMTLSGASTSDAGLFIKGTFENNDLVTVSGNYGLYNDSGSVTNSGTINASGGTDYAIRSAGSWTENTGAVLNLGTNGMIQTMTGTAELKGTVNAEGFGVLHNYGTVTNTGGFTVTNDSSRTVASVYNSSDALFENRGSLSLDGRYAFKNTDGAETHNYGTLTSGARLGADSDLAVENTGNAVFVNEAGGTITFRAGGIQNYSDGIFENKGAVETAAPSDFDSTYYAARNGGAWTEETGSTLTLRDKGLANVGTLTLKGTVTADGALTLMNASDGTNSGTIVNSGTLTAAGSDKGFSVVNTSAGTFENSGSVILGGKGLQNGGAFTNKGTLRINAETGLTFAGSGSSFVNASTGQVYAESSFLFKNVASGAETVRPIEFDVIKATNEEVTGAMNLYAFVTQGGGLTLAVNDNWAGTSATFEGGTVTFTNVRSGSILADAVRTAFEGAYGTNASLAFTGTDEGSASAEVEVRRDSFGIAQANAAIANYGTGALLKSIGLVSEESAGTVTVGTDISDSIGFQTMGGMTKVAVALGKTLALTGNGKLVSFDEAAAAAKAAETGRNYAVTAFETEAGGTLTLGSTHPGVTAAQGGWLKSLANKGTLKVVKSGYKLDSITNSTGSAIDVAEGGTIHAGTLEGTGSIVNRGTLVADAGLVKGNIDSSGLTVVKDFRGGISSVVTVGEGGTLMAETFTNAGVSRASNGTLVIGGAAVKERFLLSHLEEAARIVAAGGTVSSRVMTALEEAGHSTTAFSLRGSAYALEGRETSNEDEVTLAAESGTPEGNEAEIGVRAAEEADLTGGTLTRDDLANLAREEAAAKALVLREAAAALRSSGLAYEQVRMGAVAHDGVMIHSLTALEKAGGVWADAIYSHTKTDQFKSDTAGLQIGWDGSEGKLRFGAALALQKGDADTKGGGSDTESNAVSVYASYPFGGWIGSLGFTYSDGSNDLRAGIYWGDAKTDLYTAGMRLTKMFTWGSTAWLPYAGVDVVHFSADGFTLQAGEDALSVQGGSKTFWRLPVGFEVRRAAELFGRTVAFSGTLGAVWQPGLGKYGKKDGAVPLADKLTGELKVGTVWQIPHGAMTVDFGLTKGSIRKLSHEAGVKAIFRF